MALTSKISAFLVKLCLFCVHLSTPTYASSPVLKRQDTNLPFLSSSQILQHPFPYDFPILTNPVDPAPNPFPMPPCNGVTLEEATIDQLQDHMSNGRLTSVQIVTCYLQRMLQVDGYTNAILQWNPDAFTIASSLDAERRNGIVRSPLHGIPFLIKDNFATKDRMETTAGSWALQGSIVPRDAYVVSRLRDAGAVLLGHATLSEWADMRSSNYSEGYSARGGQTRSPYNLTLNPGGSSSGSGAAVAANLAMISLGTETDGSVISPAERNAVVGIKPTVGLTSRAGVIPESAHQDTVGTFGRTVRDAVYALDAIYGIDSRDNYTIAQEGHSPPGGYVQFVTNRHALEGAVFGLPWESFWIYADGNTQGQLLELINLMRSAGATVINGTEIPNYQTIVSPNGWDWDYGTKRGYSNESEFTVVKVDFYNNIKQYLSELENTDIRSLEDIVEYNIANLGTEGGLPSIHPAFGSGQDSFLASLETQGIMDETYYQALSFTQTQNRNGIDGALSYTSPDGTTRQFDALLVPSDVGQTYQAAAQAGYPQLTIPAGINPTTGMPFGLSLMGTAWSEPALVKWASAIEDLQKWSGKGGGRTMPRWWSYRERNLPVLNL